MARISKANAVKSKAKAKSLKEESSKSVTSEKRSQIRLVAGQKNSSSKAKETSKVEAAGAAPTEKKVSQRLIETIEKRRQAKGGAVGRVPGRRGRRRSHDILPSLPSGFGTRYRTGGNRKQRRHSLRPLRRGCLFEIVPREKIPDVVSPRRHSNSNASNLTGR